MVHKILLNLLHCYFAHKCMEIVWSVCSIGFFAFSNITGDLIVQSDLNAVVFIQPMTLAQITLHEQTDSTNGHDKGTCPIVRLSETLCSLSHMNVIHTFTPRRLLYGQLPLQWIAKWNTCPQDILPATRSNASSHIEWLFIHLDIYSSTSLTKLIHRNTYTQNWTQ